MGCGGGEIPTPAEPPIARPATVVAPVLAPTTAPDHDDDAPKPLTNDAEGDSDAQPKAAAKADPDPNAKRDITYTVVPEGLKISVAGVKFTVTASAAQIAAGWGVKLSVVASASDGKAHSLASPKTGPLAFAGFVQRKAQPEAESFGDERAGNGEQSVFGDDVTKFSRTWPAKGTRVLAIGEVLDLQVALWGLGLEKEERRPVKQFCHVRMQVGKGKPRPIVEPPASATGK